MVRHADVACCCGECFLLFVEVCVRVLRCYVCACYMFVLGQGKTRTFEFVAMGSVVLFILSSRLLLCSTGSGVNRVYVGLAGFSVILLCFVQDFFYVCMVVCISWLHSCLCI